MSDNEGKASLYSSYYPAYGEHPSQLWQLDALPCYGEIRVLIGGAK